MTERDPATILEPKNGGESFLDIRRVPLPSHLKSRSEKEDGIQIFECFIETDSCQPLVNEVITYEEAKGALIKHNITYGAIGVGAILATTAILLSPAVGLGGAAIGATATAAGGTVAGPLGATIIAPAVGGIIIGKATSLGSGSILAAGIGGVGGVLSTYYFSKEKPFTANPTREGRQMRPGNLPKDGPLLRKILSKREVIAINNIERLKRELTEIIQLIVEDRR